MAELIEQLSDSGSAQLAMVLEAVPQGIALFDARRKLCRWNPRLEQLIPGGAGGLRRGLDFDSFQRLLPSGRPVTAGAPADGAPTTSRHLLPDGTLLEMRAGPPSAAGFVVTLSDETEQEQHTADRSRLRDALELSPAAMLVLDPDDRIVMWNERLMQLSGDLPIEVGITLETMLRRLLQSDAALASASDLEGHIEWRMGMHRNYVEPFEEHFTTGRWVLTSEHRTADGGTIVMHVDISERKRVEDQLRVNKQRLEHLLETSPIGVDIQNANGQFLFTNVRMASLLGMTRRELMRARPESLWAEPARRRELLAQLERDGYVNDAEAELVRADGERIVCLLSWEQAEFAGQPALITWIYDITERKRAEAALRDSEHRLRAILEASPIHVAIVTREGECLFGNSAEAKQLGPSPVTADRPPEQTLEIDPAVRRRLVELLDRDGLVRNEEVVGTRADGSPWWAMVSWLPVEFEGRSAHVVWAYDVTERRLAEQAQQELFQAIPLPLIATSAEDGAVLQINAPAADLFDVTPEQTVGARSPDFYVDISDRARLLAALRRDGRVDAFEVRLKTAKGDPFWALVNGRTFSYRGQAALLVSVNVISVRKRLEEELRAAKDEAERALREMQEAQTSLIQAEKMASLGQLVAGVAHEINTPIGIALTGTSHLADKTRELWDLFEGGGVRQSDFEAYMDLATETTRLVLSNLGRAAELIQGFKQIAVDQASAERRRFVLGAYIDEVLLSLRPKLKMTPHQVAVTCPPGLEIDSYPGAVSQVVTNLVLNALVHAFDADRPGRITIDVAAAPDEVEMRVADDGKGIPAADLPHVFEPFFTTRRSAGGSGLGLYVVYNLVSKTLGGRLTVTSEPGATVFTLRFPRVATVQE